MVDTRATRKPCRSVDKDTTSREITDPFVAVHLEGLTIEAMAAFKQNGLLGLHHVADGLFKRAGCRPKKKGRP